MEPHITVRMAASSAEYDCSIRWAARSPDRYVIYAPQGESHLPSLFSASDMPGLTWSRSFESQSGQTTAEHHQSPHVVLALTPGEWRLPAQYFASARGARLIDAAGDPVQAVQRLLATDKPQYLTVVGHPHRFDGRVLLELMAVQSCVSAPGVGILTHRSPARLSELVFKNLLYGHFPAPGPSLTFAGVVNSAMQFDEAGARSVGKPLCTAAALTEVQPRPLRALAILNHGRPDTVNLVDAKICGQSLSCRQGDVRGTGFCGVPACHFTGECHLPSQLVAGEQVPAAFVMVNSCFSLGLGSSLMDLNYSLTLSLLDGTAAACLSSPIMREGKCVETALIMAAVRDGMPIGEAARLGARILSDTGLDQPSLLLIGDPSLILYPEACGPGEAVVQTRADNVIQIMGPSRTTNLLRAAVPVVPSAQLLNDGGLRAVLTGSPAHRQPLFWTAVQAGKAVDLVISAWTPVDWSQLALELRPSPVTRDQFCRRISATYTALTSHSAMGINPPRSGGRLQQISDAITNLATLYDASWYDLRQQGLIRKREAAVSDLIVSLELDALEHLLSRTDRRVFHFPDAYRHLCTVADISVSDTSCPQCGDQCLTYELHHQLRSEFKRQWLMCVRCGVVADSAVSDHGSLSLSLDGPRQVMSTGSWQGTLVLTNKAVDEPISVYAGVRMIGGNWHDTVYDPEQVQLIIAGGGTRRIAITITPSRPPSPHHRWLRAYALSSGQIYSINRDIFVVPEGSDVCER